MQPNAALDSQAVLAELQKDGTFDKLRHRVLQELRQHPGLRDKAEALVSSHPACEEARRDPGRSRKLFPAVRKDLEKELVEAATQTMWEILTSQGYQQEIEDLVQATLCRNWEAAQQAQQAQQQAGGTTAGAQEAGAAPSPTAAGGR